MSKNSVSSAEELLTGLDNDQRVVAEELRGPVCVLAGAGTGKTCAITHRIAYGIATGTYSPDRVLALTFTNRAAREMLQRVEALVPGDPRRVWGGTFHSIGTRLLRRQALRNRTALVTLIRTANCRW